MPVFDKHVFVGSNIELYEFDGLVWINGLLIVSTELNGSSFFSCGGKVKLEKPRDSSNAALVPKKRKSTQRQSKSAAPIEVWVPPCFVCGGRDSNITCNSNLCQKSYHLRCLDLQTMPKGEKYTCPRHNCKVCFHRTNRCCVLCLNSYCAYHANGHIRYDRLMGFVCYDHDPMNLPKTSQNRRSTRRKSEAESRSPNSDDEVSEDDLSLLERLNRNTWFWDSRFRENSGYFVVGSVVNPDLFATVARLTSLPKNTWQHRIVLNSRKRQIIRHLTVYPQSMSDVRKDAQTLAQNTIILHLSDNFACGVMNCCNLKHDLAANSTRQSRFRTQNQPSVWARFGEIYRETQKNKSDCIKNAAGVKHLKKIKPTGKARRTLSQYKYCLQSEQIFNGADHSMMSPHITKNILYNNDLNKLVSRFLIAFRVKGQYSSSLSLEVLVQRKLLSDHRISDTFSNSGILKKHIYYRVFGDVVKFPESSLSYWKFEQLTIPLKLFIQRYLPVNIGRGSARTFTFSYFVSEKQELK
ncbi:hypothetical protein HUJ04_010860 [Dendroctonus ponderosae]|nr:hypothetical protein HUJ04_010860 [Dendroctonus ponderosae]